MKLSLAYLYMLAGLAGLIALASLAGAGWLIYDWGEKRGMLSELQFAYESAAQKHAYSSSARTLLRDIESDRKELASITAMNDPVEIIRYIEGVGKIAKVPVTVQAVTPGLVNTKDPSLGSLTIAISASGTFAQLHQFASLLETMPIPSILEQVKLERRENAWDAEIVLRVFIEGSAS